LERNARGKFNPEMKLIRKGDYVTNNVDKKHDLKAGFIYFKPIHEVRDNILHTSLSFVDAKKEHVMN
jgi:hypothetical protein